MGQRISGSEGAGGAGPGKGRMAGHTRSDTKVPGDRGDTIARRHRHLPSPSAAWDALPYLRFWINESLGKRLFPAWNPSALTSSGNPGFSLAESRVGSSALLLLLVFLLRAGHFHSITEAGKGP